MNLLFFIVAAVMILVGAVAKVQTKNIRAGIEQATDNFWTGACRPEGGDDLCVAVTAHSMSRPVRPALLVLGGHATLASAGADGTDVPDTGRRIARAANPAMIAIQPAATNAAA